MKKKPSIHLLSLSVSLGLIPASTFGSVIVASDFNGATREGTTLSEITWTTTGVTAPAASVSVNNTIQSGGNGDLFTTGATDGFIAPANNTGNGGEWNVVFSFTTQSDAIELDNFVIDWANFNGTGGNQNAVRNTELTLEITDLGMNTELLNSVGIPNAVNTMSANTSNAENRPKTETFDLTAGSAPIVLAANTNYEIFIQAGDATTSGNNFGIDAITLNGTLVPKPSSLALLGARTKFTGSSRSRWFARPETPPKLSSRNELIERPKKYSHHRNTVGVLRALWPTSTTVHWVMAYVF